MNWKAKYIIGGRLEAPIVFPEAINHSDMARNLGWIGEENKVIGAGFVFVEEDGYKVYGESISLRVKNRGVEDEKILNRYLGGKQEDDL
jgi:hypothetical protein